MEVSAIWYHRGSSKSAWNSLSCHRCTIRGGRLYLDVQEMNSKGEQSGESCVTCCPGDARRQPCSPVGSDGARLKTHPVRAHLIVLPFPVHFLPCTMAVSLPVER